MKALVTGGAGFIGSHIVDALLARGDEVVVLDDLSAGKRDRLPSDVRLETFDVRCPEAGLLVGEVRPDVLFHLAAQMDVRRSVEDPGYDSDVNIGGLLNVLQAAITAGTRRVIFSSTGGAIYGEQDVFPAPETHATRPTSPYGCAKAASELYLGFYHQQYDLESVSLRYANVYGPRQDPHGEAGVVAIFAGRLLRGERCTIFGDGTQTRDYVFVEDVVRANLLAIDAGHQGPLNIGTGVETDVLKVYREIAREIGVSARPVMAPARPGEQQRSVVDASRAWQVLGWAPEMAVGPGLARTVEWFRDVGGSGGQ